MVSFLAACSDDDDAPGTTEATTEAETETPTEADVHELVGTWKCQDDTAPHEWFCRFTFNPDGTFVDYDGDGGRFTTDRNTLTLDFDDFPAETFTFRIRGDELTITDVYGDYIVLIRQ